MKNFKSIFLLMTVIFVLSCYTEKNSDDVLGKIEFPGNEQTPGETTIEWGNDNAVYAVVQPAYAGQALEDAENGFGAFEPLDIKAVYVVGKALGDYTEPLKLLLVLNNAGEAEQEAAVAILRGDSKIKYALKCDDVPFETVNTLHLSASSLTVKVGDTLTVKPEGTLKVYQPTFSFDSLGLISLANYNIHKQIYARRFPASRNRIRHKV